MVLCVSKRISSAPFSLPAWIKARRSNRTQRGWSRMSQQVCLWSGRDARRPTCPKGGHFVSLNDSWSKGGLFCYHGNRPLTGRLLAWRLDSCQCKPISFLPGERVWAALPEPAGEVAGLIPTGRFTNIQKWFWNFSDVFRIFLIEHSILKIFHKVLKVNTKPYLGFQPVGWASCGSFKKKKTISPCLKICPSTKSSAVRFWKSSSRNPWKLILKRRKSKLQLGAETRWSATADWLVPPPASRCGPSLSTRPLCAGGAARLHPQTLPFRSRYLRQRRLQTPGGDGGGLVQAPSYPVLVRFLGHFLFPRIHSHTASILPEPLHLSGSDRPRTGSFLWPSRSLQGHPAVQNLQNQGHCMHTCRFGKFHMSFLYVYTGITSDSHVHHVRAAILKIYCYTWRFQDGHYGHVKIYCTV